MKNNDLSDAIGNINLKYVEEARNYTAKRMTLTKVVSLAACIAILVTAIPAALILNREDVNTDAPAVTTPADNEDNVPNNNNTDNKTVKIVYCDAETAEEIKKASQNENIEIKDVSEIETDLSAKVGDIEANAEIPARLYKTIGGKDYIFNFSSAYSTTLATSSNEQLKKQGSVAVYGIEGKGLDEVRMEYSYETGKVVYLRLQKNSALVQGDLTSEQALALAERDFAVLYGDEFSQTYSFEFSKLSSLGSYSYYAVQYRRMICGYPTDEVISAIYSMNGELITVVAPNLGLFDCVDSSLTIDKILKAEADALELIGNQTIEYKYLTVDKEGKVYMYVAYSNGGRGFVYQLYYAIDGSSMKTHAD